MLTAIALVLTVIAVALAIRYDDTLWDEIENELKGDLSIKKDEDE